MWETAEDVKEGRWPSVCPPLSYVHDALTGSSVYVCTTFRWTHGAAVRKVSNSRPTDPFGAPRLRSVANLSPDSSRDISLTMDSRHSRIRSPSRFRECLHALHSPRDLREAITSLRLAIKITSAFLACDETPSLLEPVVFTDFPALEGLHVLIGSSFRYNHLGNTRRQTEFVESAVTEQNPGLEVTFEDGYWDSLGKTENRADYRFFGT
jgi:hypothetical protein